DWTRRLLGLVVPSVRRQERIAPARQRHLVHARYRDPDEGRRQTEVGQGAEGVVGDVGRTRRLSTHVARGRTRLPRETSAREAVRSARLLGVAARRRG